MKAQKIMKSIRQARDDSHKQSTSPARTDSREDNRQVVQVLQDIVPVQRRERYDEVEDADQQNASSRHREIRLHYPLLHEGSLRPYPITALRERHREAFGYCPMLWRARCTPKTI